MKFNDLNDNQRFQLKQRFLTESQINVSYEELVDADNLVSNYDIWNEYGDMEFSEDDFCY